ncbi:MAG: NPCBM/NEW2 domain-containing protein, partial [Bacilli bacterium]|nr:NPCBM/NEW2 domain-containing protein [Bacilli bacterium]
MKKISELRKQKRIALGLCVAVLLVTIANFCVKFNNYKVSNNDVFDYSLDSNTYLASTDTRFIYLSDIPYDTKKSATAWGSILLDKTSSNTSISVKVENANYSFEKGIWAHATSTVVYDLSNYSQYDYFTAYVGLNATAASSSNGVKFYVYTSTDGTNWTLKTAEEPEVAKPGANATFIKVDIKNAKYLKLYANDNGSNGNDHAVYADAKLIKETYKEPGEELVPSIDELDKKIKTDFANAELTNPEYELTLLKRELISRVGNYALKRFLGESEDNRTTYKWLTSDVNILRLYVMGGKPDGGSYYNSLGVLTKLYKEYSSDFQNTQLLNNPTNPKMTYGDLYKKMAMSIALTHTQRVGLWMQNSANGENDSDPLRRYAIFKYMHKTGKLKVSDSMDMTHTFEDLYVEEMRIVLSNNIDDEEILWLNKYVQDNVDRNPGNVWRYITPHPYIAYVWPNYSNSVYYDAANVNYFNELFAVSKSDDNVGKTLSGDSSKVGLFDSEFVIPGGKSVFEYRLKVSRGTPDYKLYKVWMNFRNKFGTGAVCGGISKSGANIRGTHGIPAVVVGQPGHAALLFYSKDEKGRGYWRLDNDVSGWTLTGKSANFLGWSSSVNSNGFSNGVYMEFEQAAVNDHENLIKAEEQVMLAKVYSSNPTKQEELYRKALKTQSINFDAWLGLI